MPDARDDADLDHHLQQLEETRRTALTSDDMVTLAGLLSDDLVHVHTSGLVHGKAELLAHAGGFLKFIDIVRGPLSIRSLGPEAAIMSGTMANIVRRRDLDERVTVNAFVTQIWSLEDGDWRILRFHATRLPEEKQ